MKFFKTNQLGRLATATALIAGALFSGQAALACTVDNWSAESGTLNAAPPNDDVNPAARYSGVCGLEIEGGQTAFVQDNSPAGNIDRIIARFYVLADDSSEAVVYRGRNGSGATLFDVSLAGDTVTATSGAGTAIGDAEPGWNSIEIDWSSGSGMELIVNGATPVTANTSAAGMLQDVQLGNLSNANVQLTFDSYESRRTTAIGRLLRGDANASGTVNVVDASAIVSELDGVLQAGQPDCNENGVVNIVDASCVVTLL